MFRLSFSLFSLVFIANCMMSAAGYQQRLDRAVSVSPGVDPQAYQRIAIDHFVCTMGDGQCDQAWSDQAANLAGMTLGRAGYEVYDSAAFHALFLNPPAARTTTTTTVVHGQPTGISASISAGPGGMGVSIQENHTTPVHVVTYETVPEQDRLSIIEYAGIAGVVTGRITIGTPDNVTKWRRVHVAVRLVDAVSAKVVWQGEWEETMVTEVDKGVADCLERLSQALEHRVSLYAHS